MNDERKQFVKLNTSIYTGSNSRNLEYDSEGNIKSVIELRLPDNLANDRGIRYIDFQTSKLRLSLSNLPVAMIPVDPQTAYSEYVSGQPITTKLTVGFWTYYVTDNKSIQPSGPWTDYGYFSCASPVANLKLPLTFESIDIEYARRYGYIPLKRLDTLIYALEDALIRAYSAIVPDDSSPPRKTNKIEIKITESSLSITICPNEIFNHYIAYLYGTPGLANDPEMIKQNFTPAQKNSRTAAIVKTAPSTFLFPSVSSDKLTGAGFGVNLIGNSYFKDLFNFLPWLTPISLSTINANQYLTLLDSPSWIGSTIYVLNSTAASCTCNYDDTMYGTSGTHNTIRVAKYVWENIPTILLSPISSVVILVDGLATTPQILPINIQQGQGSSLTTTIPVIENYFPLTTSIRDLHDDLIISREPYSNTALFSLPPNGLAERTLRFRAGYVTKSGELHEIFIPPTGVFILQITFCLHY